MMGFGEKKEYEARDVLIVFGDNGTADIASVIEINEERILASGEVEYSIPLEDAKPYSGKRGRIFAYKASEENITDTKRLAALERSTVLKQITLFEKENLGPQAKFPVGKMLILAGVLFVIFLYLLLRK